MDLTELELEIDQSPNTSDSAVSHSATSKVFSDEDDNTLRSDNSPFSLSLRISSFPSEKELDIFIKNVERMTRFSNEYKQWVSYIIDTLGHDTCALTEETITECKIEIHHHPITLYSLCKAVVFKYLQDSVKFCSFDVATNVIELHFKNKVGYVPLLSNLHEKYHKGFLNLPIELIHGDFMHIIKSYPMDDVDKDRALDLCNVHGEDSEPVWKRNQYPGIREPN